MRERESQALGVHPFEGFSKGGFSLGALLGLLAGAAIFGTLVNVSGKFQTQGMFASSAACAVLLGGWRLRWGRFPYARALGVMALAALFSVWVLKRWPARVPPTPPRQVGPKMTIDGANFSFAFAKSRVVNFLRFVGDVAL